MARDTLLAALLDARRRGEHEGTAEAVRSTRRRPRVRVTRTTDPRAAAMARALAEMDTYDMGGDR